MLRKKITELLANAIISAQKAGKLPTLTLPEIVIEHPQKPEHGDYACSIPLKLARTVGTKPLTIANEIAGFIAPSPEIAKVNVAAPGFINFTIDDAWLVQQVDRVLTEDITYGNVSVGQDKKIQIEFVSVNPTGPLHVGHGRHAVLGSTLASVLSAAGFKVEKEYYVNDAGNQIDTFRRSLYASYKKSMGEKVDIPEDGYHGDYIATASTEIAKADEFKKLPEDKKEAFLGERGLEMMLEEIKSDLKTLDVTFDRWYRERDLYKSGLFDKVMAILRKDGYLTEREGATWFVSTALGDDKDNVVIRTDGTPTYFASDIAYHYNKFIERGFDKVIDIWGADHAGHVSRMKAVLNAFNIDPNRLTITLAQMVTLRRGGDIVKISKRTGDFIRLSELVEEVGSDACRFFFLSRTADAQMDFDIELAKEQSVDNPVYYVQYAHARIASILRLAEERSATSEGGDVSLLTTEPELTLIRKMLLLPEIVETIAQTLEPHHLTYYAQELATVFHAFYKNCRVVTDDAAMTAARLKLVKAAKIVLGRTLNLMGMNAPDKM
jgi:arginyl-tRNA synthetase